MTSRNSQFKRKRRILIKSSRNEIWKINFDQDIYFKERGKIKLGFIRIKRLG